MVDELEEITAADMEAAGERIAARDGVTVEEVRERVRRGGALAGDDVRTDASGDVRTNATTVAGRTCALDGCDRAFVPTNARHRFCTPAHRAADHRRVRTDGAS